MAVHQIDGLPLPGSGDGVGPGPVNEHVKYTEVGNSTAAERLCGPADRVLSRFRDQL